MLRVCLLATILAVTPIVSAAAADKVDGTFVVNGTDAKLHYVRAQHAKLDEKGKSGYAILLSERPAEGDIAAWRTAEPSKRGSFIYLLLETNGAVWVAELGHRAAKSGRFGVVTELTVKPFAVKDGRITAHAGTAGEQEFSDNRYRVDIQFDAPLEK